MLPRNNADVTHCEINIFKTKRSTELKTGRQIYVLKWLLPDKGNNSKFLILVFLTSRENQELFMSVACLDIRNFFMAINGSNGKRLVVTMYC